MGRVYGAAGTKADGVHPSLSKDRQSMIGRFECSLAVRLREMPAVIFSPATTRSLPDSSIALNNW